MIKKDGHSHTEFCPHGSGDDVEAMIQKAIKFGFTDYCITEHAPLPPAFRNDYEGTKGGYDTAAIAMSDLDAYFAKCERMRSKYADQIRIHIGFEVDYLPAQADWTHDFLNEYGPRCDESILSVHFMRGVHGKYWPVDDELSEFEDGLLPIGADDKQDLYAAYLDAVQAAVAADLGKYAPVRIGHITLIKKFQDYFDLPKRFNNANMARIDKLLATMQRQGRQLDVNAAGLFKEYCNEIYPYPQIIMMARARGIKTVYGSDAHSIKEVGHAYHQVAELLPAGNSV
ncbi:histidinol-phosphatase HisJ [Lacticaseibacillus zhaodongensis]|uniref:histidinol-phosphatase HisJ n=1 Tax=Lacticaseibacillus zhaodongensis TaxID=2668065 RepID=UPI0018AFA5B3|nr:histidinol-phosphatase HisJ [Lacticaseibacillus zhaodongensis]